jgi:hypothetical protein
MTDSPLRTYGRSICAYAHMRKQYGATMPKDFRSILLLKKVNILPTYTKMIDWTKITGFDWDVGNTRKNEVQ